MCTHILVVNRIWIHCPCSCSWRHYAPGPCNCYNCLIFGAQLPTLRYVISYIPLLLSVPLVQIFSSSALCSGIYLSHKLAYSEAEIWSLPCSCNPAILKRNSFLDAQLGNWTSSNVTRSVCGNRTEVSPWYLGHGADNGCIYHHRKVERPTASEHNFTV
jgi:hypothetical protein